MGRGVPVLNIPIAEARTNRILQAMRKPVSTTAASAERQ